MRSIILLLLFMLGSARAQELSLPSWAEQLQPRKTPTDQMKFFGGIYHGGGGGGVQAKGRWLTLDSGLEIETRGYGLSAWFRRLYYSNLAQQGKHAPGLPDGWTYNYYVYVAPKEAKSWDIVFHDYTGSEETFKAILKDGKPTGEFEDTIAPYKVSAEPGDAPGTWKSISITNRLIAWIFIPSQTDPDYYHLHEMNAQAQNLMIRFKYQVDEGTKLVQIDDQTGDPLVYFTYDQGWLASVDKTIVNNVTTSVKFAYSRDTGKILLVGVGYVDPDKQGVFDFWRYHYTAGDKPLIDSYSIKFPDYTHFATWQVTYDDAGKVKSIVNPDGAETDFDDGLK